MKEKEFNKFFVASLKRTAQNVSPLVRRKQKLNEEIADRQKELESIQKQIEVYQAPIKEATGGFGVEDLVVRTVEITDKLDKEGKPVKITKWSLKYPETIVPVINENEDTNCSVEEGSNEVSENVESSSSVITNNTNPFEGFNL